MEQRVFTKDLLKSVNTMAHVQGYNRVIDEKFLARLPDQFYTPMFTMLHEHKAGKPCDPHVRCVFNHEGDYFMVDVEMGCWDMLPTANDFQDMVASVVARREDGDTSV